MGQIRNMINNNYEVDILVNDKPIKKYSHNGKIYVEAKFNQNYAIRIKNNSWSRILSAVSVDGLSVLSGKNEEVISSPGYVINGYNSTKIDGFRISDEEVASFKFSSKSNSYAASKQDNSEQNVGIVGVRIFAEKEKPAPVVTEIHHYHDNWNWWNEPRYGTPYPTYPNPIIWGGNGSATTLGNTSTTYNGVLASNGTTGEAFNCGVNNSSGLIDDNNISINNCSTGHLEGKIVSNNLSTNSPLRGFDLGTSMGEARESKVTEVEFERGLLVDSIDIYYASRESLIEMGVPISNEKQVNFPSAFKNEKYCTPPKNW